MPIAINFEQNELKDLLEYYQQKRSSLESQLGEIDKKIADISSYAQGLNGNPKLTPINPKANGMALHIPFDYPTSGTWLTKIAYIIEQLGGKATTSQIAEKLLLLESNSELTRTKAVSKVSAIISINSKENGIIAKEKYGSEEAIYRIKKEATAGYAMAS